MSILYDMRSGELVKSRLINNGLLLKNSFEFSPLDLFKDGKQGLWLDPSELSTMFQDAGGTMPVTADGDPVGLILDKSQGLEKEFLKVTLKDLRGWLLESEGVYKANKSKDAAGSLTLATSSPLVTGRYYTVTFNVTNYLSGYVKLLLPFDSGFDVVANSNGSYTFSGFAKSTVFTLLSISGDMTLSDIVITEIKGNHASQSLAAARPTYRTDADISRLYYDKVDDLMSVTMPAMTATTVVATDDGVAINYPVTIAAGKYAIENNSTLGLEYGRIIIEGELTALKQADITDYYNTKRGV